MIFVTVGTHEQPFNRLIEHIDDMKKNNLIKEDIVMQIGFGTFEPKYCIWQKMFPFQEMKRYIDAARIVITHGGPASFIMPLQIGKIPIVVPRRKEFNEHVNDHQVLFCREVFKRQKSIIEVESMEQLNDAIINYDSIIRNISRSQHSNNKKFCEDFERIVDEVLDK